MIFSTYIQWYNHDIQIRVASGDKFAWSSQYKHCHTHDIIMLCSGLTVDKGMYNCFREEHFIYIFTVYECNNNLFKQRNRHIKRYGIEKLIKVLLGKLTLVIVTLAIEFGLKRWDKIEGHCWSDDLAPTGQAA